jgi:hypothetical protein
VFDVVLSQNAIEKSLVPKFKDAGAVAKTEPAAPGNDPAWRPFFALDVVVAVPLAVKGVLPIESSISPDDPLQALSSSNCSNFFELGVGNC